jgi:hypothetical protein
LETLQFQAGKEICLKAGRFCVGTLKPTLPACVTFVTHTSRGKIIPDFGQEYKRGKEESGHEKEIFLQKESIRKRGQQVTQRNVALPDWHAKMTLLSS